MKALLPCLVFLFGCAVKDGGTSTGNPLVSLKFASFNSSLSIQEETLSPLAVSNLKMCFKRLRFKTVDQSGSSATDSNLDFYLGEVTISNLGTSLSNISLPLGTYRRVEMDLNSDCPSGKSIQVTNGNGYFSTNQGMTIKFEGTFTHSGNDETLSLVIQQIVSALNTVSSDSQIRNQAESASGSF